MPKPCALVFGYKTRGGTAHEGMTIAQAIGEGLIKHGYDVLDIRNNSIVWGPQAKIPNPQQYALGVVFGYRQPLREYVNRLNHNGIPCLVGELGYLKRPRATSVNGVYQKVYTGHDYYQVSLNKLCWLPPPYSCSDDRFNLLNLQRADARVEGQHVLILGQTIGDAQHGYSMRAMVDWVTKTFNRLRKLTDRELVWRPHPKQGQSITGGPLHAPPNCDRVARPDKSTLEQDLKNCHAVVTINSTAGNEALLQGVPVFCEPFSMYAEVANTDLAAIENPAFPSTADYFNRLAYAQWTLQEMADGAGLPFWERHCDEFRAGFKMAGVQ